MESPWELSGPRFLFKAPPLMSAPVPANGEDHRDRSLFPRVLLHLLAPSDQEQRRPKTAASSPLRQALGDQVVRLQVLIHRLRFRFPLIVFLVQESPPLLAPLYLHLSYVFCTEELFLLYLILLFSSSSWLLIAPVSTLTLLLQDAD